MSTPQKTVDTFHFVAVGTVQNKSLPPCKHCGAPGRFDGREGYLWRDAGIGSVLYVLRSEPAGLKTRKEDL